MMDNSSTEYSLSNNATTITTLLRDCYADCTGGFFERLAPEKKCKHAWVKGRVGAFRERCSKCRRTRQCAKLPEPRLKKREARPFFRPVQELRNTSVSRNKRFT